MLALPGPIVSVAWLADHLHHPDLRLADVRWSLAGPPGIERYAAGHLRGAVFLDAERGLSSPGAGPGRHPIPSPEKLARVLGDAGIGDDHVVVAYDDAGGSIAARVWWLYRHYGREGRAAVLDGGIDAWTDAGLALVTEPASHPAATWSPGEQRDDAVGTAEVRDLLGSSTLLLDARAPERYRGETEPIDPRAGHIPGSLNVPYEGNVDEAGAFLPRRLLADRYAAVGDDPVVYCGSGITACHDLLALAVLGRSGRLYEGSWSDWCSEPDRPAVVGPSPR